MEKGFRMIKSYLLSIQEKIIKEGYRQKEIEDFLNCKFIRIQT